MPSGRASAASLIDGTVRAAARAEARRLYLDVAESNAAARALYAACGFAEAGRPHGLLHAPRRPPRGRFPARPRSREGVTPERPGAAARGSDSHRRRMTAPPRRPIVAPVSTHDTQHHGGTPVINELRIYTLKAGMGGGSGKEFRHRRPRHPRRQLRQARRLLDHRNRRAQSGRAPVELREPQRSRAAARSNCEEQALDRGIHPTDPAPTCCARTSAC